MWANTLAFSWELFRGTEPQTWPPCQGWTGAAIWHGRSLFNKTPWASPWVAYSTVAGGAGSHPHCFHDEAVKWLDVLFICGTLTIGVMLNWDLSFFCSWKSRNASLSSKYNTGTSKHWSREKDHQPRSPWKAARDVDKCEGIEWMVNAAAGTCWGPGKKWVVSTHGMDFQGQM